MTAGLDLQRRSFLKAMAAVGAVSTLAACDGFGRPISDQERATLNEAVQGKVYWKGDAAYETARGNTAYRANKPKRFPQVIVQVESDKDVVASVKFAKLHKLKVTTRSGGHSWSSSHIRDDCLLIDMSKMQEITINEAESSVWVNPGVIGSHINAQLAAYNLIIPTAHHPSPGIGGFCMNGGFGWNNRLWGNGCHHVLAIEVVNESGDILYCDEKQNVDYWWAARGSGAGFFAVVTRMKLHARPMPKVWRSTAYIWDDAEPIFDELMTWGCTVIPQVPRNVEMIMMSTAHDRQSGEPSKPRIVVASLVIADTEEEATAALEFMKSCPVRNSADVKIENKETNLEERYQSGYRADPAGYRFAADNFYTNAPAKDLVPRLRKVFLELPTPHTHSFWFAWGPTRPLPENAALSAQGDIYVATYTLWTDPEQDAEMEAWPPETIKAFDDISTGAQMNDENMLRHPQKYYSSEAYAKIERLRAKYDPTGVFESWLGNPMPA
jgi:FAD/FMN-containing dehydrogenase